MTFSALESFLSTNGLEVKIFAKGSKWYANLETHEGVLTASGTGGSILDALVNATARHTANIRMWALEAVGDGACQLDAQGIDMFVYVRHGVHVEASVADEVLAAHAFKNIYDRR